MALSVCAHVSVAAFASHGPRRADTSAQVSRDATELITVQELSEVATSTSALVPVSPRESAPVPPPAHRHAYPVAFDHDSHPHDPSVLHVSPLALPSTSPAPSDAEPVRFVLSEPSLTARGSASHSTHVEGGSVQATGAAAAGSHDEIFSESDFGGAPARLLAAAPAAYPAAARAAELEADVPVEIVVGPTGQVLEARALAQSGYGLDAAAVRAIRGYRFSPAQRDGRPVRVRMHWTVQFRLR